MKRRFANVLANMNVNSSSNLDTHIQFVCSVNDDDYKEILSYNELMNYIEKDEQQHQDEDGNGFWNFKRIVGHEGPFRASDPEYKGSRYNVLVEWENGEITSEPLNIFGKDDPVTCAVYACEHGLLEEEGWKRFKGIARREKKMLRMVNQSHIKVTSTHQDTSSAIVSLAITMRRCN
jgi:hypothetical protein